MKRHISGIVAFLLIVSTTIAVSLLVRNLGDGICPPIDTGDLVQPASGDAVVLTFAQYDSTNEELTVRMRIPDSIEFESDKLYTSVIVTDGSSQYRFSFRRVAAINARGPRGEVEVRYRLRLPQPDSPSATRNFRVSGHVSTSNSDLNTLRPSEFGPAKPVVYVH